MTLSPTLASPQMEPKKLTWIRVELGEEVPPKVDRHGTVQWVWKVDQPALEGLSRQPLLDACRELKRIGVPPGVVCGLFRKGRDQPDLTCTVGSGAAVRVDEAGPLFRKWAPHPMWRTKGSKA